MKSIVVIPARLESTRLPEKPLIELRGKSVIQRTYEQCTKVIPKERIFVATDHNKIFDHCKGLGIEVILTSNKCLTGTDRVAEVAGAIPADYYINVQGDEPILNPQDLLAVEEAIEQFPGEIINGYAPIEDDEEMYLSLTVPKVVFRPDGRLLYMSRAAIPGNKNAAFRRSWRQICIYAFPRKALLHFSSCQEKTPLEAEEDIEILRFLELGYEVRMIPLSTLSLAVDTQEDVIKVIQILDEREGG